MDATVIMDRLQFLGIEVTVSGDKLRLEPGSRVPKELVDELKANKQEIILLTKRCHLKCPGEWATGEELDEISRDISRGGYVLLWSNILQDLVAFYMNAEDRTRIPPNFVPYSLDELRQLFGGSDSPLNKQTLKLIHEAKKGEAKVTRTQLEVRTCHACGGTSWWQREDGEYVCQRCHPKPIR